MRQQLRAILLLAAVLLVPACDGGPVVGALFFPQVLFEANPVTTNRMDVYATDDSGLVRVNLTQLPGSATLLSWIWSPDRAWLAFIADAETTGVSELFVVAPTGGTPLKVSGALVAGGNVTEFAWAPNSSRLAYRADQDTDEVFELYTVTPAGTGLAKASGTMVAGGDVAAGFLYLSWSPDSTGLAYMADQNTDGATELYVMTSAGGVVKVSAPVVVVGGGVTEFAWAPNSARLAYLGNLDTLALYELQTVLPTGSGGVKLSGTIPATVYAAQYIWSPDSSRVAYLAAPDSSSPYELYSNLAAGGGNVKLNGTLPVTPSGVGSFAWAPNSGRVAYTADQDTAGIYELYSVPAAGGGNVKLSGALVSGGSVTSLPKWAPDSSRVAYLADQNVDDKIELYTSLAAGGGNVKVSAPINADSDVRNQIVLWSPDSSRIAYEVQIFEPSFGNTTYEVWTVSGTGASPELVSSSFASLILWTGDSSRLVFTAQDYIVVPLQVFVPVATELFAAEPDGSQPVRLSGDMGSTSFHRVMSAVVR